MTEDDYIPSGSRERRLSKSKRLKPQKAKASDAKPRQRSTKSDFRKQIERVLNGDSPGTGLGNTLGHLARRCNAKQKKAARGMLLSLERQSALLLKSDNATAGVVRLARFVNHFSRSAGDFVPSGDTPEEQLRRLANLVLEEWAVPQWLNEAWLGDNDQEQNWFVHLGSGKNLTTAPDLPYPLTRRMAHFAVNAPRGLRPLQALRWGQCRGFDIAEVLCQELVNTRISEPLPDEPFWKNVINWFAVNPEVLGHASTIIDYCFAQRIGDFAPAAERNWIIKGRTPDRLLSEAREWHAELNRRNHRLFRNVPRTWRSCGFPGLSPKPEDGDAVARSPRWWITELTSADQLELEGKRLHHCVAFYTPLAATGRSAIYSLRRRSEDAEISAVTIEIRPADSKVVQARSMQNAQPNIDDQRLIEHWAKIACLSIAPEVFQARLPRR